MWSSQGGDRSHEQPDQECLGDCWSCSQIRLSKAYSNLDLGLFSAVTKALFPARRLDEPLKAHSSFQQLAAVRLKVLGSPSPPVAMCVICSSAHHCILQQRQHMVKTHVVSSSLYEDACMPKLHCHARNGPSQGTLSITYIVKSSRLRGAPIAASCIISVPPPAAIHDLPYLYLQHDSHASRNMSRMVKFDLHAVNKI